MSSHTPGPWSKHSVDGSTYLIIGPEPASVVICALSEGPLEANAALIEAAPKLLQVCRGFIEHFGHIGFEDDAFAFNHLQAARTAVAEALLDNKERDMSKRFTQSEAQEKVGRTIRTNIAFSGVPKHTTGRVVRADAAGRTWTLCIEWNMQRQKPLQDWFGKYEYEKYLEEI